MQLQPTLEAKDVILVLTAEAGGYRHGTSANAETQARMFANLVPKKGEAKTVHGMLLLGASRIYSDLYDNDGGNMINNIHDADLEEGDEDWQPPEYELDPLYQKFFDVLEKWLPVEHQSCLAEVKKLVLAESIVFDIAFDHLTDRVLHTVLTTEDISHPTA